MPETTYTDEDGAWEEAFKTMNKQEPLFKYLPTKDEQASKVFIKFKDIQHSRPIVLAKNVGKKRFEKWLHDSELGLYQSVRTEDGLVYMPQSCTTDHGLLRAYLGNRFRIVSIFADEDYLMEAFSGAHGGLNPDVKWMELHTENDFATVVFEVGISQSLPDLRRKAYRYCNSEDHPCLEFVVLIKRYRTFHLYIEIWRKIRNGQGPPDSVDNLFVGDQRDPRELGSFRNMTFFANAHAEDVTRNATVAATVAWQRGVNMNTTCSIPRHVIVKRYDANGELIPRQDPLDGTVTFDAVRILEHCRWGDVTTYTDEDGAWEEAFKTMNEQEPLFKYLPTKDEEASKVFNTFDDIQHSRPIVLAKNVGKKQFEKWLHDSELGLYKSVRTEDGFVYMPQSCTNDHGSLRAYLCCGFRIVIRCADEDYLMKPFSGAHGGLNPDLKWTERHSRMKFPTVVFEVGISQSLPDLRRKAYRFCNSEDHPFLEFVVLLKRYRTFHLYIEIWRKIRNGQGPTVDSADNLFLGDQRAPQDLGQNGSFEKMTFFANAHAEDGTRANVADAVAWQCGLNTTCSIPYHEIVKRYDANGQLVPRQTPLDGTVTFDAESMLAECEWGDVMKNR